MISVQRDVSSVQRGVISKAKSSDLCENCIYQSTESSMQCADSRDKYVDISEKCAVSSD